MSGINVDPAGTIRTKYNNNFSLPIALMELIDNSVDADAKNVHIYQDGEDLIIEDDGSGFKDLSPDMTFCRSDKEGKVGRYGVGMIDACIRYSQTTIWESNGKRRRAPWLDILLGRVEPQAPLEVCNIENDGLTRIILEQFSSRYKSALPNMARVRKTYHPLIANGAIKVCINGVQIPPSDLPDFTETIEEAFSYRGKKVLITGGIYDTRDPNGKSWSGYQPYYRGRLIGGGDEKSNGRGNSSCWNFCFFLHLDDDSEKWELATNKDKLGELDDLLEYCYTEFTEALIKKADSSAEIFELKDFANDLTNYIAGHGNITRKNSSGNEGTVTRKSSGRKCRQTFSDTTEGEYIRRGGSRTQEKEKIEFGVVELEEGLMARATLGKWLRIDFNKSHPFVARLIQQENRIFARSFAVMLNSAWKTLVSQDELPNGQEESLNRMILHASGYITGEE